MSNIMVVNDEVKECELLKGTLEADENKYEVITSNKGMDAIEK